MEVRKMDIRKNIIMLLVAITLGSMFYSCSQQRGLAQVTTLDTMLVPKEWRPSTLALKQAQQQPTKPLKLPTEEQLQFNKKLNYVLDNAGTSFDNIGLIRGDISDLRLLIENRAIVLRNSNDSLTQAILDVKSKQIEAINFAHTESLARIASEKRNMDEKLQNDAYKESTLAYASFAFGILVILSIIRFVFSYMVYRKQKYLKSQLNYV